MKEVEFTLSSDNKNWMDTSVISDTPKKVTIIDPRPYVVVLSNILGSLKSIQDEDYTRRILDDLSRLSLRSIMQAIIYGRRAWINGEEAALATYSIELRKAFGAELDPIVRDKMRFEMDFDVDELTLKSLRKMNLDTMDKSLGVAVRLTHFLQEIADLLKTHMNPNTFVMHELTISKDGRSFWLEEYDDWRVVQWTKEQQAKLDSTHARL